MDPEVATLVGTIFTSLVTFCGILISNSSTRKRVEAVNEEKMNQIKESIEVLSDRQDKHNQVIERTYIVERDVKTAFNQIGEVKEEIHKIDDKLEKKTGDLNSKYDKINESISEIKQSEIRLETKLGEERK